jgi:aromatic-L-amino-acid decarboxylase
LKACSSTNTPGSTAPFSSADFEILVEPPFNLVCFLHKEGDEFNMKLMNTINESGKIYFSHTKLNNQVVLRMSIGQTHTERQHVEQAWKLIEETARELR